MMDLAGIVVAMCGMLYAGDWRRWGAFALFFLLFAADLMLS